MFLTIEEVKQLTGKKNRPSQVKELCSMGVFYEPPPAYADGLIARIKRAVTEPLLF